MSKFMDWAAIIILAAFLGWYAWLQAMVTWPAEPQSHAATAVLVGAAVARIASRCMKL